VDGIAGGELSGDATGVVETFRPLLYNTFVSSRCLPIGEAFRLTSTASGAKVCSGWWRGVWPGTGVLEWAEASVVSGGP